MEYCRNPLDDGEDEKSARVCAGKTEKSGAWAATELVWAAGDIFGVDPKLGRQPQFLGLLRLPASQMFVQPPSPLPPLPSSPVLEPPATTAVQAPAWAVQSAGSGSTIATDGAGGAFVTGWFSDRGLFGSTSLLSSRSMSTFVMHVTASGTIDWGVKAGGESECAGYSIASDGAGGAFVAGYFGGKASFGSTLLEASDEYDVFVMHVTASGAIDWAVQAGGMGSDHGYEIAQDGMGGALVTGDFSGKASFGSTTLVSRGSYDAFVMHVTASGVIDWAVQAGGEFDEAGNSIEYYGIAHDGAGGAFATGDFRGEASFGSTSLTSTGTLAIFVMHMTASGAIDWAIQAGGWGSNHGHGIAHDGAGGALVTGDFMGEASFGSMTLVSRGNADAFVMHVTASGVIDWAIQAGGASNDEGRGIAHDGLGGAFVIGSFAGTAWFQMYEYATDSDAYDAFVMHVTASGAIDWVVRASSTSSEPGFRYGLGIAHYTGSGRVLVSGTFMGDASFGSKALSLHADKPSCFAASLVPGKDTGLIPFPDVEIVPSPPPWSQAAPSSAPTREGIPIGDSYAALGASLAFAASILTVSALLLW